jgi:uncharacterized protein YjbI with pentapeptide repeats
MSERDSGVPEGRCGFEVRPEDVGSELDLTDFHERREAVCCWRETWRNGRCLWHADTDQKPVDELVETAQNEPDRRLDGAIFRDVELKQRISFAGFTLTGAQFENVDIEGADFSDAECYQAKFPDADLKGADFSDAECYQAKFPDADLKGAEFSDAYLRFAEFSDAYVGGAEFHDADLFGAKFPDAYLRRAKFSNAVLTTAEFSEAFLQRAEFPDAYLAEAMFPNAYLEGAEFPNVYLEGAEFPDADLREAEFSDANLRATTLTGTDLRGATITGADLRRATIEDITVSQATEFGRQTLAEQRADSISDWDEIAQVHHTLKIILSEEHGLVGKARKHYIWERRARRREALAGGDRIAYAGSLLSHYLAGYGVDYRRVVVVIGVVFLVPAFCYWQFAPEIERTLYYSIITLTTAPPGPPGGVVMRAIAGTQAVIGTLLVVLLGDVLRSRESV